MKYPTRQARSQGAMTLARGEGWHGTFTVTLMAAVRDILDDGQPFDATVWVDYRQHPLTVNIEQCDGEGFGSTDRWLHWPDVERIEIA